MPKLAKISIYLVSIILIGWVMWTYLGVKPMSKDLSVIGDGKPAVVLVYESYNLAGMDGMERLKQVRADFEPYMHFRIAHIGTPEGDMFVRRHDAFDGVMVLFDGAGEVVRVTMVPQALDQLKAELVRLQ